MANTKIIMRKNAGMDVGKEEYLFIGGRGTNWKSQYGNECGEATRYSVILFLGTCPKDPVSCCRENSLSTLTTTLTLARKWK
ncbi:hypothetical protein STEG23_026081, partial [Scotinomys teguina]